MLNNHKKDRSEARHLIVGGTALISVSIILALFLGIVGCSGGAKNNPADPASSNLKKSSTPTNDFEKGLNPADVSGGSSREGETGDDGNLATQKNAIAYLAKLGEVFGENPLRTDLVFGVYDAESGDPIEGAYASVSSVTAYTTDADGFGIMRNVVQASSSEKINRVTVTAGAEGYELVTHDGVQSSMMVFYLNPLVSTPVVGETFNGTFTYETDDYLCSVYASHVAAYTDGLIAPSEPGDLSDTYSIDLEPIEESIVAFAQRHPSSQRITSFIYMLKSLSGGEEFTFDHTEGDGLYWINYPEIRNAVNAKINLGSMSAGNIQSITGTCYYVFKDQGYLPMTDLVDWSAFGNSIVFNTSYASSFFFDLHSPIPIAPDVIPTEYDKVEIWLDVQYEDGSGRNFMLADSNIDMRFIDYRLSVPPEINPADLNGELYTGVTPTMRWTVDPLDLGFNSKLTIVDTENGNRWILNVPAGATQIRIPKLPVELQPMGLRTGRETECMVETELGGAQVIGNYGSSLGDGPVSGITSELEQRNYSKVFVYMP